jgi:hypothetical protein
LGLAFLKLGVLGSLNERMLVGVDKVIGDVPLRLLEVLNKLSSDMQKGWVVFLVPFPPPTILTWGTASPCLSLPSRLL